MGTKYINRVTSDMSICWELALSWNTHSRLELVDFQAVACPETSGLLQVETNLVFDRGKLETATNWGNIEDRISQ
jgi:hypothetical protein